MTNFPGRLITFEGGEGSGKSTQARFLADALTMTGMESLLTREPGGTLIGEEIRRFLLLEGQKFQFDSISEVLLYSAARREHWVKVIKPALEEGKWVVCDRFVDSTRAYQGGAFGVEESLIESLIVGVTQAYEPDATFILDIDPEEGLARARNRGSVDRYESLTRETHDRIRKAFGDIARQARQRCLLIDASGDCLKTRDAVFTGMERRFSLSLPRPEKA